MIVIDIETSGLDPNNHALISLGAVNFEKPDHIFYSECRVFKGAKIDEQALVVNGFTVEDITDPSKQDPKVLLLAFREYANLCSDTTLAGMNPGVFDIPFLEKTAKRERLEWSFARRSVDLHTLCYAHMRIKRTPIPIRNNHTAINLARVLEYVGLEGIDVPHHALEDAKLTAECISRLLYAKPLLEEFQGYPVPSYLRLE